MLHKLDVKIMLLSTIFFFSFSHVFQKSKMFSVQVEILIPTFSIPCSFKLILQIWSYQDVRSFKLMLQIWSYQDVRSFKLL